MAFSLSGLASSGALDQIGGIAQNVMRPPPLPPQSFDGRDTINITPPQTNLGEILRAATGSTYNGGFGAPESSFFGFGGDFHPLTAPVPIADTFPYKWVAAGIVGIGVIAYFWMN